MLTNLVYKYQRVINNLSIADGLAPLLLRLILAPVMIIAGFNKLNLANESLPFFERLLADPNVIAWFGNPDWGLGLPMPNVLAFLAGWTEFLGGWLILFGLFTRLISIPLMFTMLVAATTVHWHNGWFAVAPSSPDTSAAKVLDWFSIPGAKESLQNSEEVSVRLERINRLITEHGFPDYLLEKGTVAVLNNGIEFSATYFAMFLVLFFVGGGRYTSLDYWLSRKYKPKTIADDEKAK